MTTQEPDTDEHLADRTLDECLRTVTDVLCSHDMTRYLDGIIIRHGVECGWTSGYSESTNLCEMGRCFLHGFTSPRWTESVTPIQRRRNEYAMERCPSIMGRYGTDYSLVDFSFVIAVAPDIGDTQTLRAVITHELIHAIAFPYGGHGGTFEMLARLVSDNTDIDVMSTTYWHGDSRFNAVLDVMGNDIEVTLDDGRKAYVDGIADDGLAYLSTEYTWHDRSAIVTMDASRLLQIIGTQTDVAPYEDWLERHSRPIIAGEDAM